MEQVRGEAKPAEGKQFRLPAFDAIKGPRCFGCNDYGHIAAKCPKKIQSLVCYPNLKHSTLFGIPGIINGRQVGQMILDTASGITQVHQRWVPKEAMTGGNVRVTGVEGTTHTLLMATVRLQVDDCDQEMPVAVSNKLEYDALLVLDVALVRNMIPEGGEEIRQGRPRRICPRPETYAEPVSMAQSQRSVDRRKMAKFQADRKTLESSQQNHRWTLPQRMRKKQQTPQMYLEWYQ